MDQRPTVINMSWGYFSRYLGITGGRYRGVDWTGSSKVSSYGMTGAFDGVGYRHPIRIASVDADVEELIEAGDYDGLQKLPRNANPVRLHNRCQLTGRPRGYMRQFGISRVTFREMALEGKIPGVKKASW